MASKTVVRSGNRTSRLKATSRGVSQSRRSVPLRPRGNRSAERRNQSLLLATGLTCGRAMRATWLMAAKGVGSAARSIGRARDIEPGHRRDGIALALLGLAVVVAASSWFDAARPIGAWVDAVLRMFIGSAVVVLPLVIAAVAVVLMRTQPHPDTRPRLILGVTLIALSFLGLRHLWSGSPETPEVRRGAAGFLGFAIGGPLSDGLTAWIAAPLLFIGALFGLLLLTGTTIREVPEMLRGMFGTGLFQRDYDNQYDAEYRYDDIPGAPPEDVSDYYDGSLARDFDAEQEAQGWPATELAEVSLQDDVPTTTESAVQAGTAKGHRRNPRSAEEHQTQALDRVIAGSYTLPSMSLLVAGDPPKKRSAANNHMASAIDAVLTQFKVDAAVTG